MRNYRIKFSPIEYYFFGGEKHNDDLKVDYFVESNEYPQQTTILGMLRYLLLADNELIKGRSIASENKTYADELIGEGSFEFGKKNTYGKIQYLSPLYFNKGVDNFYFAPFDFKLGISDDFVLSYNGKRYNSKMFSSFPYQILNSPSGNSISLAEFIFDVSQVGNEKSMSGPSKEDAYYKQKSKRFERGWSFAVNVLMDYEFKKDVYFIPFGGEKSFFKLEIEDKVPSAPDFPAVYHRKLPTLYCISDCFVDNSFEFKPVFAVNDYVSFRNFQSKTSTKNYYALKHEKNIEESMVRSKRLQLLKRGSVLYFSEDEIKNKFKQKLETTDGYQIGFNHVLTN